MKLQETTLTFAFCFPVCLEKSSWRTSKIIFCKY